MKLYAILGYYYPTGGWNVVDIVHGPFAMKPEEYKRRLTKEGNLLWPEFTSVHVEEYTYKDGQLEISVDSRFKLPEVMSLEQSIQRNKQILSNYLARK